MQNEMLAVEERMPMKVEVGEVKIKTETAEVVSELFGIEDSRRPTIKCANTKDTVVNRSKEGHIVQNWKNDLETKDTKDKLGEDVNYEELKIGSEELIVKDENDDLNYANGEIDVDRSLEIPCEENRHPKTADKLTCTQCNTAYKRKLSLDDHIVRKHPHLIASVSSKIHECTHCRYKTTVKSSFDNHMLKHSKTNDKLSACVHCNAKYKNKVNLDDHIIRKHPEYIASVSHKIHECTQCSYKTVIKANFNNHIFRHSETADSYKFSMCIYCNAKYKHKINLDNHKLKQHPEYIAPISRKIHECTHCSFKTVRKAHLARHMLSHPETVERYNFSTCIHCNAAFRSKRSLDNHMLRKHPVSMGSISTKIHECMHCAFKTVRKSHLACHMSKHPEISDRCNFSTCIHCNITLSSKQALDGHILRKHPDAIGSISTKIYECGHCMYKTIAKCKFDRHMLKHP